jgi:hypothetical protein
MDSVDVGAYFWHEGRLYLPVKRGVRPSIALRELQTHPVHTDASVLHFEGLAGSLSGQRTIAEIAQVAALEVEEEGGIHPAAVPVYVGFDHPSPGYCPERTYRFLTEVDPSLPAKLILHPLFEKYRDVLVGRLLRFHVMDSLQSKVIYDTWVSNPEVARTALRFCVAFDDRATYEDFFEESLRRVMRYAEGMNPLKAHLGRTLNFDMRVQALRLAYLRQELLKTAAAGALEAARDIDAAIDRLHAAFQRLSELNRDIHDIELSEPNLRAFRYLNTCREEAIAPAKVLGDRLSEDSGLLTGPQREGLRGRVLPFFKDINMMRMDDVPERVERLEQESRLAARHADG